MVTATLEPTRLDGIFRMDAKYLPARLRELRTAAGLTQAGLAEKSGLSQNGISHWEQGDRVPGIAQAIALAEALGVTVDDLFKPPATPRRQTSPAREELPPGRRPGRLGK